MTVLYRTVQNVWMARPLEFDRDRALQSAMKLFWRQGYSATSLQQLLECMAISRSSFYASFGDKRALFVECLELFAERTRAFLQRERESNGPLGGIRGFFEYTLLRVPAERAGLGCMMVNSILELADVDDELNSLASELLGRIEADFAACLQEAQDKNLHVPVLPPAEAAAAVMLVNQGLRVACREGKSPQQLSQLVNTSFTLLGIAA